MGRGKLVGIVTTTDLYKVMAQVLGFGKPGAHFRILGGCKGESLVKAIDTINKSEAIVLSLFHVKMPKVEREDCIIRVDTQDASQIIGKLKSKGFKIEVIS